MSKDHELTRKLSVENVEKIRGLYLFSGYAIHKGYNIDYVDISLSSYANIHKSYKDIDLNKYDYIIATPPCNFWSRARGNKNPSKYSLETKECLLWCLEELPKYCKPIIIENVRNNKRFEEHGIFQLANMNGLFYQFVGRHTYFTNCFIDLHCKQEFDFRYGGKKLKNTKCCLGGKNVHNVIDIFIAAVNNFTASESF